MSFLKQEVHENISFEEAINQLKAEFEKGV
ncbi:hypothetical protein [Pseudomonas sp. 2822-17]